MPTYTIHAPPNVAAVGSDPERFVFVRDGFHFWAFALAPLWLLVYRQWLALVVYLAVSAAIVAGLYSIGAPWIFKSLIGLPVALLVGFEASAIRRWTLARRGWLTLGFVVAEDEEMAEQRFYSEWTRRAPAAPPPAAPAPKYSTPVRRGPPSPGDVIGLFPEPGSSR